MSSSAFSLIGAVYLASVVLAQSSPTPAAGVPDVVVRARCLTCHAADIIQQQRLDRSGWEREVDKMIRWGALVAAADRSPLLDSLEATSASPSRILSSGGRGAEVFAQQCVGCHALEMVEQQRLGSAAWRREVDKMAGWGARVHPEDKDFLVTYLFDRFGVR
jgi:cytochrome c5